MWPLDRSAGKARTEHLPGKHPAIRRADVAAGARGMGRDGTNSPATRRRCISYCIWPGAGRVSARVMNELGTFGWALFGEG
jgi:hypothetical protein